MDSRIPTASETPGPLISYRDAGFDSRLVQKPYPQPEDPIQRCPFCSDLFIRYVNVNCITDDSWDIYLVKIDGSEVHIGVVGGTGSSDTCQDGPPPGQQDIDIPNDALSPADIVLYSYDDDPDSKICALKLRAQCHSASGSCASYFALLLGSKKFSTCGLSTTISGDCNGSPDTSEFIYVSMFDVCSDNGSPCDPPNSCGDTAP